MGMVSAQTWPDCPNGTCRTAGSVRTRALQFVVLGDTGGLNIPPYYTSVQQSLAEHVNHLAEVDFALLLGDNFYFTGVRDADDARFESSFANVYKTTWPFYPTSGNHDWFGSVDAQVEHSAKDARWRYPSTYHSVMYAWPDYRRERDVRAQFVFVDTVQLCGNLQHIRDASFWKMITTKTLAQPSGPDDVRLAESMWQWLERTLAASTADYLFVVGHYPVHSVGANGPFDCLVARLRPLLHAHGVNAYFAGHDHNMQHIVQTVNGTRVDYIVSGAGSQSDNSRAHSHTLDEDDVKYVFPPVGGITPNWLRRLCTRQCEYHRIASRTSSYS